MKTDWIILVLLQPARKRYLARLPGYSYPSKMQAQWGAFCSRYPEAKSWKLEFGSDEEGTFVQLQPK